MNVRDPLERSPYRAEGTRRESALEGFRTRRCPSCVSLDFAVGEVQCLHADAGGEDRHHGAEPMRKAEQAEEHRHRESDGGRLFQPRFAIAPAQHRSRHGRFLAWFCGKLRHQANGVPPMKAYRFDELKSLDDLRLHDEAEPRPQRGEVLIRVHAVSLNYRDIAMLTGRYPRPSRRA